MRSIYGPHLSGDGLAFTRDGKYLLSASWRTKNQLQVWDWARGALHLTLPWGESNVDCRESVEEASALAPHPQQTYDGGPRLYGVALSGASGLVLAGGSGVNEAKVWHLGEALRLGAAAAGAGAGGSGGGGSTAAPLVATVTGMERGVFALDWCPGGGDVFVLAGGDAPTRVVEVKGVGKGWPPPAPAAQPGAKAGSSGSGSSGALPAGAGAVWGPDGDSLLLDFGVSPSPTSPVRPPRRVLKAQAAAQAAAASAGGSSSSGSSSSSGALVGGGGGAAGRGSPTPEEKETAHPVVSLFSPGPRSMRKGSAAMRAVSQAREMAAVVGGGGGGCGGGGGAALATQEDEDDGEEEEEEVASPEAARGFLSRL